MTLFFGGPFALNAFMDEADIVPPPAPIPPPPITVNQFDEEEAMLIGSVGFALTFAGAGSQVVTIPRSSDVSTNNPTKSRYPVAQIDVTLSAAGVVSTQWDVNATADKLQILTGFRQLAVVPSGATTLTVTAPGAGTVTVNFGRVGL